ncbi:MAG: DUF6340 family protein [Bacteroidales bacterium]|nr:DUF6340 family protein [Bacteroidales bacterium]
MKPVNKIIPFLFFIFLFTSCEPLKSLQIETLTPSQVNLPRDFNKILFVNLDNDINNDNEKDTMLYGVITEEMNYGFLEIINSTSFIDSLDYLYIQKGFPSGERLYQQDTISWDYLGKLAKNTQADIFVVLDSLSIDVNTESFADLESDPVVYFKYRELNVAIHWSMFSLKTRKRLDSYLYSDNFYWESSAYSKEKAGNQLPSLEKSVREISFFAAFDYGKRIFPNWQKETRFYFVTGNKDFTQAAKLVTDNEDWKQASVLWKKHINHIDREISSRACFNLALANEMQGNFAKALDWAMKSDKIKSKTKTRLYISILKQRNINTRKLKQQLQY